MKNPIEEARSASPWLQAAAALLPAAVAYFYAYVFEQAYANAFGIPSELVTVELSSILKVGGALLTLFFGVFAFIGWIDTDRIVSGRSQAKDALRSAIFICSVLFLAEMRLWGTAWSEYLLPVVAASAFFLAWFAMPWISYRKEALPYLGKLDKQMDVAADEPTWARLISNRLGRSVVSVGLVLVFGIFLAYETGRAAAKTREQFLVLSGNPEQVVVARYEDRLIIASVDRKNRRTKKQFRVVSLDSSRGLALRMENVGRLKIPNEK